MSTRTIKPLTAEQFEKRQRRLARVYETSVAYANGAVTYRQMVEARRNAAIAGCRSHAIEEAFQAGKRRGTP